MIAKCYAVLLSLFVILMNAQCSAVNNSAILISRYSKVAHWGLTRSSTEKMPTNEGRSNSGQTLWTHRSDVNIVTGQNLKNDKNNVVYHYAIPKKQSQNLGLDKAEKVPAIGEVQDRFNPRPYFDYVPTPSKYTNPQFNSKKQPKESSFNSAPVFNKSPVIQDTPDSYNSPYDSYNPPAIDTDDGKDNDPLYPPNDQATIDDSRLQVSTPGGYSYAKPDENDDTGYDYKPTKKQKSPLGDSEGPPKQYQSFGPPLAPPDDMDNHHAPGDHMFYPPDDQNGNHEVILDHPPPGYEEDNHSGSDDMGDMQEPMQNNGEGDLNPPPSDGHGKFPQYLYNGGYGEHDFGPYDADHHHVYEVVEPPTTPPPHDERVNKGHYSYYYLGRKLWYIPLYFSVYFIIYVTILILKSIARHKIHLKHDFHDKFRKGREMELNENIDDLHKNVTTAIYTVNTTYIM